MPRNWEQREKKVKKRANGNRMRGNRDVFEIARAEESRRKREDEKWEKKGAKEHRK
jgi:hypothetical protein